MKATELTGKKCYNHLGGKLGAALFAFLIEDGWIAAKEAAPTTYELTEKGMERLREMGMELPDTL